MNAAHPTTSNRSRRSRSSKPTDKSNRLRHHNCPSRGRSESSRRCCSTHRSEDEARWLIPIAPPFPLLIRTRRWNTTPVCPWPCERKPSLVCRSARSAHGFPIPRRNRNRNTHTLGSRHTDSRATHRQLRGSGCTTC